MSKVKIINFKNGGVLLYRKRKKIRYSAVQVGFYAGTFKNKQNGTAHFLEHMLFAGTENLTKQGFLDYLVEICPRLNAATSQISTFVNFYRTNDLLEKSLQLASDMIFKPTLSQKELEKEKGVVFQEYIRAIARAEDDIHYNHCQTYSKFPSSLWICSKNISLGNQEDINKINEKVLRDYMKKHYNLNNFAMSVVTALPLRKIKKMTQKYFINNLTYDENYKDQKFEDLYNKKENMRVVVNKKEKLSMRLSFVMDDDINLSRNNYNYDVLNAILHKKNSQTLRDKGLIYTAQVISNRRKQNTEYTFSIETTADNFSSVINCIKDNIKNIKNELVDKDFVNNMKNNFIYNKDEVLSHNYFENSQSYLFEYYKYGKIEKNLNRRQLKKELDKVTPETIKELANKVFNKKNKLYITLLGKVNPEDFPTHKELKDTLLK